MTRAVIVEGSIGAVKSEVFAEVGTVTKGAVVGKEAPEVLAEVVVLWDVGVVRAATIIPSDVDASSSAR